MSNNLTTISINKLIKNQFKNNKTITKRQMFLLVFLLLLIVLTVTLNFFYDGIKFLTLSELTQKINEKDVMQLFLPVSSIFVGLSLPLVGLSLQTTTRNNFAEPTTLGFYPLITTGFMITQFIDTMFQSNMFYLNFIFGFVFSFIIIGINFLMVRKSIKKTTFKSVLIGFAIGAFFTGINAILAEKLNGVSIGAVDYITGSITNNPIALLSGCLIITIASIILFLLATRLSIIAKDYLLAKSLGIKVDLIFWIVAICSVLIAVSSAVLFSGVMLIGLIIPYLIRFLSGSNNLNYLLPASAMSGIVLLSSAALVEKRANLNINFFISIFTLFVFMSIMLFKKIRSKYA